MVGIVVAAKGGTGVKYTIHGKIQMVVGNKLAQVGRAQMLPPCAKSVLQVKGIQSELVGHHNIGVVRHPAGDPVMAADGLQPPDLVYVLEGDAVLFIGAVLLQQAAQAGHTLPGRADVGQHQADDVLFPDAAGDHGVCPQHPGVGGDGLGSGHADIGFIDAGGCPDPSPSMALGRMEQRSAAAGRGIST